MIEPALRTPPADTGTAVTDDYIKAVNLNRRIITAAQLAQQSLYDMCMGFKEMRDSRLYKELGYSDFGDYSENETGFKRSQAYNYITIVERLPADFVQSIGQIGMTKALLLTTLSEAERTEIAENNDLESTSVRELEQQIKQLKAEKDKAVADCSAVEAEAENREQTIKSLEKAKSALDEKINALEHDIRELENRPVETAIQYIEKIPDEYVSLAAYEKEVNDSADRIEDLQNELVHQQQMANKERMKLEQQLEALRNRPQAEPIVDTKAVFKAFLTTAFDALKRLSDYTKSANDETYIVKYNELIEKFSKITED